MLVRIHAVSLQVCSQHSSLSTNTNLIEPQYRDLLISKGKYLLGATEGVVPCSDGAGEIISITDSVRNFKVGDRVCANFSLEQLHGDVVDESQKASGLGGKIDGCLTEVRAFPAYVSFRYVYFVKCTC